MSSYVTCPKCLERSLKLEAKIVRENTFEGFKRSVVVMNKRNDLGKCHWCQKNKAKYCITIYHDYTIESMKTVSMVSAFPPLQVIIKIPEDIDEMQKDWWKNFNNKYKN
jgi:hypothetical protein